MADLPPYAFAASPLWMPPYPTTQNESQRVNARGLSCVDGSRHRGDGASASGNQQSRAKSVPYSPSLNGRRASGSPIRSAAAIQSFVYRCARGCAVPQVRTPELAECVAANVRSARTRLHQPRTFLASAGSSVFERVPAPYSAHPCHLPACVGSAFIDAVGRPLRSPRGKSRRGSIPITTNPTKVINTAALPDGRLMKNRAYFVVTR